MHLAAILDLIAERETTAGQAAGRLREQITALTAELARLDAQLANLATTRTTLKALAADQFTDDGPTITSAPYQQILAVLTANPAGMRARDICIAVGVDPVPKHLKAPGRDSNAWSAARSSPRRKPEYSLLPRKRPNLSCRPLTGQAANEVVRSPGVDLPQMAHARLPDPVLRRGRRGADVVAPHRVQ
ncbi:hypothetical protein Asi03nite_26520 [Actinoplanes siamensis]|uniref:Uncharacterized protein n=1 Tax=Actinoplanes siamensis TaxID=1223317 RepID=A0A919N6B3_9ACTN|nr:hypothetical protein Asi03nite_26520 [Actinoplanes siamensis]